MTQLPAGTVTFLFTDIEGSTQLWEKHPQEMRSALAQHDSILQNAITSHKGYVIKTTGDGAHAVFERAIDALHAAIQVQAHLHSAFKLHPSFLPLKVRMGLHTAEAELRDGDYYGQSLNRAARIMSIGHGGQILLSETTAQVAGEHLPADIYLIDLGVHHLKGLQRPEKIFQLVARDLQKDFPPLNSIATATTNLPIQLTSFVGREKEISEIIALLNSAHLVTLTGSGGTGKTRLSIEVGIEELTAFTNGVWLIELAPLADPLQIIPALAQAFGLQELPFRPLVAQVMDYLRDKKLLLILDNCEHLIEACARLADDLLHQCVGLKILASSREALGIAGEVAYRTPSLADSESTRLFIERARAANSNFKLTDANASAIAQICHRLDGIPLAIELAAARTKLLSAEQIAARLDDMFRLLIGGSRTALLRQQTLRALIDWSYDLLSDEEKRLLQFASVFVGGWTLDALEFVADEPHTIELLGQLVNKSLVVTEEHEGEMRYFMLETIRQYAREKLFEAKQSSSARDRHFIHYKNITSGLWDVSYFARETETQRLKSVQLEVENLRAAFEWSLQNHVQDALEFAANMAMSMSMMGGIEGITILKSAMDKFRALPPAEGGDANRLRKEIYAHGCFSLGTLLQGTNEIMFSRSILQEAIAIARELGDKKLLGLGLEMYANGSAMIKADDTVAAAMEGLEIFRELNHSAGMRMAYANLARWEAIHGNFQESEKYMALVRASMKDGAISIQSGFLIMGMGMGARYQGRFDLAQKYFEEGLTIFKYIGHKGMAATITSEIAHTQRAMGNYAEARKTYQNTIKVFQDYGNRPAVAHQLECFAMIAAVEEEPLRAAKLFAAAEAIRDVTGHKRTNEEEAEEAQFMGRLRAMLPEAEFNALWAEGRSMTMEQAIELALS
ncbi:MAG: adenylate/guanylate cyclase domain-containing protein [Chloroflexota bacterium]